MFLVTRNIIDVEYDLDGLRMDDRIETKEGVIRLRE